MVRDYELMYIVRPELDDEGLQAATQSVDTLIQSVGGSVVRSTSWGRRRLAYEVDHLRDGHYMLLHLRVDGGQVANIERALTIHDTVFRHLLVLHEAGAEIEAVDPDTLPATAVTPVDGDAADADADDADVDDSDEEAAGADATDAEAGADKPADDDSQRQTAVGSTGDDGVDQAGAAGDRGAAAAATTEEDN